MPIFRFRLPIAAFLSALFISAPSAMAESASPEKLHVIIETDLGGDPDDEASMVRFLLYACDFHIDGIILTNPDTRKGGSGRELYCRASGFVKTRMEICLFNPGGMDGT